MSEEKEFIPWAAMVDYVNTRKISYMNKPEWEQLFMYIWIREHFQKSLLELSVDDIYEIGDKFNLDFTQASSLLKKCRRIEIESEDESKKGENLTFKDIIDKKVISNIAPTENLMVRIKVLNRLVYEELQKILNLEGIYSDTSFSKDILTIPMDGFCKLLIGKETFTLKDKALAIRDTIAKKIEDFFRLPQGKNKKQKELSQEMIDKLAMVKSSNDMKTLFKAVKGIIGVISPIKANVIPLLFKAITESSEVDLANVISDMQII